MNLFGKDIEPTNLLTMENALGLLRMAPNYHSISAMRDGFVDQFGKELIVHYPISDGMSLGGYILPVQEGFLWLPYDEVSRSDGELLRLENARLLTNDECEIMLMDFRIYSEHLCAELEWIVANISTH